MIMRSSSLNQGNLFDRIRITLGIVFLARLGTFIPIPGVDQIYFSNELRNSTLFTTFSSFLQGDTLLLGIFTLGILPNLNASIAIQLLSSVLPPLKRLTKEEGELGQKKVTKITRYLTAAIALQYGLVIAFAIKPYVFGWDIKYAITIAITLMTGSLIILWLSELINETGIGNGTSLFIFINIVSCLPSALTNFISSSDTIAKSIAIVLFFIGIISIVIVQDTTRQIKTVSLKELLQESSNKESRFIAFRLNPSGIMPLILASSLINLILAAVNRINLPFSTGNFGNLLYLGGYFLLTLFFSYFYSTITLNPIELSKDLRKRASSIPSIPPGLPTMKHLQEIINRISLLGGLFLALIVSIPSILAIAHLSLPTLKGIGSTSVLILSGVAVDLSRQVRTYSIFGSYDKIELKDL